MRLRNVKNKTEIMNASSYLVSDPFSYCGKWNEFFGNNHPIFVEIGMGKGQFVIQNALKYPDRNFIGIEKYDSVIARALQKVPEDIPNLAMIRADAMDINQIFQHEIHCLYLNFSDPWPKNRHHSRRLSSKVFLEKYDSIFWKDGNIEMRTDNPNLFSYSLVQFSQSGYVFEKLFFDLHRDDMPLVTTEYEDKFSEKGYPIYFVSCRKSFVKKRKSV